MVAKNFRQQGRAFARLARRWVKQNWRILSIEGCIGVIIAAAVVALVIQDRARLHIRLVSDQVNSSGAISFTLNRSIDTEYFEQHLEVKSSAGSPVSGVFVWGNKTVNFMPATTLVQGDSYTITLARAKEKAGGEVDVNLATKVSVVSKGFIYINAAKQLHWFNTSEKRSTLLSLPTEMVIANAVRSDGSVVYSYRQQRQGKATNEALFGVVLLTGAKLDDRKVLTGGGGKFFDSLRVCGAEDVIVGLERTRDSKGSISETELMIMSESGEKWSLVANADLQESSDIRCSRHGDKLVFSNRDGEAVSTGFSPGSERKNLGKYTDVLSLSPKGDWIVAGLSSENGEVVRRSIFGLSFDAGSLALTNSAYDATDGVIDSSDTYLAWAEDRKTITNENFGTSLQIVIKPLAASRTDQLDVAPASSSTSDEQPAWSPDGRALTFQRIALQSTPGTRPQDAEGHLLDGEVMLVNLPAFGESVAGIKVEPQGLGIHGGMVHWLP